MEQNIETNFENRGGEVEARVPSAPLSMLEDDGKSGLNEVERIAAWLDASDAIDARRNNGEDGYEAGYEAGPAAGYESGDDAAAYAQDPAAGDGDEAAPGQDELPWLGQLPPEARAEAAQRERAWQGRLARKSRESDHHREKAELIYQYVDANLQDAMRRAEAAVESDFAGVDWAALKEHDPMAWLRLDGRRERRQAEVNAIAEQRRLLDEARGRAERLERQHRIEGELPGAVAKIKEVIGGNFDRQTWRAQAVEYLARRGATPEHIDNLTHGYQLEMVAKAMKYDELSRNAASARSKLAAAPRVMTPKGAAAADAGWAAAKDAALRHMRKNPDSTDAIAAYLNYL